MTQTPEQAPLKTNHNIRIVTLATSERVLCMFGNVTDESEEKKVILPAIIKLQKMMEPLLKFLVLCGETQSNFIWKDCLIK